MGKDELQQLRSQFYVGCYQTAISAAISMPASKSSSEVENLARQVILYRAYLAHKKNSLVINELSSQASNLPIELFAVLCQAKYQAAGGNLAQRSSIVEELKNAHSSARSSSVVAAVLLAELLAAENHIEEAISTLIPFQSQDLECDALMSNLLLKLNRLDLAQARLEEMKALAEDSVIVQLTEALVCMANGGEKYQDAFYIYQELLESFGVTAKLLNGQAVCLLGQGKWDEAEKVLLEALNKSPDDSEILANIIASQIHLQKPGDIVSRYLSQLEHVSPDHAMMKELRQKSTQFEQASKAFQAQITHS